MKLTIITPCSRPENLQAMAESIKPGRSLFDVIWVVILDNHECVESRSGNYQRNCALDAITDGWVYFLDDDTIIHPDLFVELTKIITPAVAFEQDLGVMVRKVMPSEMKVCHIDMGQVAIRREVIGDIRFELGIYEADGIFIQSVYESDPSVWSFVNKPISYYNKLR
jgi:glycosyltransferase involved in cell wall biosynthesis